MNAFLDMIEQALQSFTADVLFGLLVMVSFGLLVLLVLFSGLVLRGAWRLITRGSWNGVVASVEQKAFKR